MLYKKIEVTDEMDNCSLFGKSFLKYRKVKQLDGSYGLPDNIRLNYPFYTFEDDKYTEFMIQLLNSLEFRRFPK